MVLKKDETHPLLLFTSSFFSASFCEICLRNELIDVGMAIIHTSSLQLVIDECDCCDCCNNTAGNDYYSILLFISFRSYFPPRFVTQSRRKRVRNIPSRPWKD